MSNTEEKRVVLITGALGGIGLSTAILFKQQGYLVYGLDYVQEPVTVSPDIFDDYTQFDLSQSTHVDETYHNLLSHLPRLDTIVHCAAIQVCGPAVSVDFNKWDDLMNVNVKSIYQLSRCAHSMLKLTRGNVVIVSSVHITASSKDISMYAISKCALSGVIRNLALEWAHDGIRVNGVAPGATDTKMLRSGLARGALPEEEALQVLIDRHLIKRILQPVELSNVILFLANNQQSSAITGQTIIADGGASILLSVEVN